MSHWAENRCDSCGKRIHPNQGALCPTCVFNEVADNRDPDEAAFTAWVTPGMGADPFAAGDPEAADDVLAPREDAEQVRRFPVGWWEREPGGAA